MSRWLDVMSTTPKSVTIEWVLARERRRQHMATPNRFLTMLAQSRSNSISEEAP